MKTTDKTVLLSNPAYPPRLRQLASPPPVLHLRGVIPDGPMVALVGSRAASMASVKRTRALARGLVEQGVVVVSGGAIGVDTAGHLGALEAGGRTVAVLGSGLCNLYPERNLPLFQDIAQRGALLSSYPHDAPPRRAHFPQRNQLIAALAQVVVVLEASHRSGALNTASWARRLGIPRLAWPGSPGCARLLSQGAGHLTGVDEVMAALEGRLQRVAEPQPPKDPNQAWVFNHLGGESHDLDTLANKTGWSAARVALLLVRMELGGFVMEQGGRYRKI